MQMQNIAKGKVYDKLYNLLDSREGKEELY